MTYRQIGDAFFIAPTTVRTHSSTIYRKLGVRNKVALAALFAGEADDGLLAEFEELGRLLLLCFHLII